MYTHALLRLPSHDFASGLTQSREGAPDFERALEQHQGYCVALSECGLSLTILPADPRHPDGCFVEDTALLTERGAILMRPGAPSRQGEVPAIAAALRGLFREIPQIFRPGTVDAGDVCDADGHYLIGLSSRTNEEGARQLAGFLGDLGYPSNVIDIRAIGGLLHLKSGIAWLGDGRMVVTPEIPRAPALAPYELIEVTAAERYAANCLRLNDKVLVASGYPRTKDAIEACGYETIALDMSEFRKMDGGLSCLSLRF